MSDVPAQDVDLFAAAIELPVAERAAYLDRACSGDPDLRQRVESLLKEHDDLGDLPENDHRKERHKVAPGLSAKNPATASAITSCSNRSVKADAVWFTWPNRRNQSAGGSL